MTTITTMTITSSTVYYWCCGEQSEKAWTTRMTGWAEEFAGLSDEQVQRAHTRTITWT